MPAMQKIVQKKKKDQDRVLKPRAAKEQDWIDQELAEGEKPAKSQDYINEAVARSLFIQQANLRSWRIGNQPFFVSRFYPHAPKIIVDKPASLNELKAKTDFFEKSDIAYVALAPGEGLTPAQLRTRVRDALLKLVSPASEETEAAPKKIKAAPGKKAKKAKR